MSNLDTIRQALADAKAAAGNAVTTTTQSGGAVASIGAVTPGRPVSTRELLAQGSKMQVKAFLKVEKLAFQIGKNDALFKSFDVEFRYNEVQPFFGLRYGQSPAKYERSLDRQVNSRNGRSWADCIAEAQRLDSRCRGDYPCVDIPFTVLKDIKDGETVLVAKGEKIGWTASITNFKDFAEFMREFDEMIEVGVLPETALFRGTVKHEKRNGRDNDYGALTFVDFDVVEEKAAA